MKNQASTVLGLSVLLMLVILIGLPKRKSVNAEYNPLYLVDTQPEHHQLAVRQDTLQISTDTLSTFLEAIVVGKQFLKYYVENGDTGAFLKYGFCREFDDFRKQQISTEYYVIIRAFQYPGNVDEWLYCSINTYWQIQCFIARATGRYLDIVLEWSDVGMPTHRGSAIVHDVNGDGFLDIIASYGNQPANQDLTHVRIILGTSSGYKLVPVVVSPHFNFRRGRIYCKGGWSIHTSWVEAFRWQGDTLLSDYSVHESHSVNGTKTDHVELFDSSGNRIFVAEGDVANIFDLDSLIPDYANRHNAIPHWELFH